MTAGVGACLVPALVAGERPAVLRGGRATTRVAPTPGRPRSTVVGAGLVPALVAGKRPLAQPLTGAGARW